MIKSVSLIRDGRKIKRKNICKILYVDINAFGCVISRFWVTEMLTAFSVGKASETRYFVQHDTDIQTMNLQQTINILSYRRICRILKQKSSW